MNRRLKIAAAATLGVGASALLAQFFFDEPKGSMSKSDTSLFWAYTRNTYTGPSVDVRYGRVQVEITVVNGKIIDARALESPQARSEQYSQYAIPVLREQTISAQSADIQGASGASFTSYGWKTSLQAALKSANL